MTSEEFLIQTIEDIKKFRLPKYEEIPDVGLYLDQTTNYINSFLTIFSGQELTNSMLSNYVKQGLVSRSVKKQYYREQIAYFLFIAVVKTVLSIENIQLMLEIQRKNYDVSVAYEYFRTETKTIMEYVFGLKENPGIPAGTYSETKIILRNAIITVVHKLYLDKCFDMYRNTRITEENRETSELDLK